MVTNLKCKQITYKVTVRITKKPFFLFRLFGAKSTNETIEKLVFQTLIIRNIGTIYEDSLNMLKQGIKKEHGKDAIIINIIEL